MSILDNHKGIRLNKILNDIESGLLKFDNERYFMKKTFLILIFVAAIFRLFCCFYFSRHGALFLHYRELY